MSPFHFVHVRVCLDDAIEVYVGTLSDVVRIQVGSQTDFGFGNVCLMSKKNIYNRFMNCTKASKPLLKIMIEKNYTIAQYIILIVEYADPNNNAIEYRQMWKFTENKIKIQSLKILVLFGKRPLISFKLKYRSFNTNRNFLILNYPKWKLYIFKWSTE